MADLSSEGRFAELDIENLVEEVRDLSKRERDRLLSSVRLIMYHLLKWDYQAPLRSSSWQITIQGERLHIIRYLKDSPSLKRYLTNAWLTKTYVLASLNTKKETSLKFLVNCPYSIKYVL